MRSWLIVAAISIHAPREGCDFGIFYTSLHQQNFNPRTPRGVRRSRRPRDTGGHYISIHAPREGCDPEGGRAILTTGISIHAPREGCDLPLPTHQEHAWQFQSTHPARGATVWSGCWGFGSLISIHAPREGCDTLIRFELTAVWHFNPRTPRGVRPTTKEV